MSESRIYGNYAVHNARKLSRMKKEAMDEMAENMRNVAGEPQVCKWFGCGRRLTAQEALYGNSCIEHSGSNCQLTEKYSTKVLKNIPEKL